MKSINRNFLITSLMVLILFAFAYIASGQIIFNADSTLPFTSLQAIFVGGIILSLFSLYVACVCNKKKPLKSYEIILIFASIALFLVTTINICSYPENTDLIVQSAEGIYFFGNLNINIDQRILFIVESLFRYLFIILAVVLVPRQKHNFVFIKVIYYLTIVLAFSALTYSLVFEFDSYISFIKDSSYENSVKSFFEQKNNYGVILTLGSIATMFAMQDAKKLWSKITLFSILIIFFIASIFSLSKLNIFAIFGIIIVYLLTIYIKNFKKKLKFSLIILGIVGTLLIAITAIFILGYFNIVPTLNSIVNKFLVFINSLNPTFESRQLIWVYSFEIIGKDNLIFGVGGNLFNEILKTYNTTNILSPDITPYAHNAYIEIIAHGGIFYLLVYIFVVGWLIYQVIKHTKNNLYIRISLLIFIAYVLASGYLESTYFLDCQYEGTFAFMMILVATLSLRDKNVKQEEKVLANPTRRRFTFTDLVYVNCLFIYILPIIIATTETPLNITYYVPNIIIFGLIYFVLTINILLYGEHYFKNNDNNSLILIIISFIVGLSASVLFIFEIEPSILVFILAIAILLSIPIFISKEKIYKYIYIVLPLGICPLIYSISVASIGSPLNQFEIYDIDLFFSFLMMVTPIACCYGAFKFLQHEHTSDDLNELFNLPVYIKKPKKIIPAKIAKQPVIKAKKEEIKIKEPKVKEVKTKKEKTPIFIKPKLKDHYNSFYERLVDIYRAFIEFNSHWWNNTFFGNKTFQKISFTSSIFTFFLLILVRDVFLIDIPKIIFIIFIGVSLLVLEKKYVYWAFIFLIPFSNALPVTYIALIFATVLFIKNKCRINILQIVVPSLILLAEILLIKHHGYSNYSSAFTLFLFIFNGSYLVFEKDNLFTKKSLAYSFILGALSMFVLAFASISKMMLDASRISGTPYFEIITNYYFRFDSPLNLYSWVNYFGTSFDLSHRDMMVGDNTNNIGYYALVSIAFIYSMLPSKNTKDNAINILLLTLTLFFGIITKSRTFIVVFALVTVIYFLFLLIQKQLSSKTLKITILVILLLIIFVGILSATVEQIRTFISRFFTTDESIANERLDLLFDYYFAWKSSADIFLFGTGVNNIVEVSGVSLTPHTGLMQILVSFGLVGFVIIMATFFYIVYTRMNGRLKNINLVTFLPLIGVSLFTIGLQIIYPYVLMLPAVISILYLNNCSTIKDKITKNRLLVPLIYIPNPSLDEIDELEYFDDVKLPTLIEIKQNISMFMFKNKVASFLKKFKVNRTTYTYKKEETVDSFIVVNKKNIFSKISLFISKIYDKYRSLKLFKFYNHKISQNIIFILSSCSILVWLVLTQIYGYYIDKFVPIIIFAIAALLLNKKYLLIMFAFLIPFSNGLPQRYFALILLVAYLIKNKFYISLSQLIIPLFISAFEIINICLYGYDDLANEIGFIIIIFMLVYIALDGSLKISIRQLIFSFGLGFITYCLLTLLDMCLIANYGIVYSTVQDVKENIWDFIFKQILRLGELEQLIRKVNAIFKPAIPYTIPTPDMHFVDNANNIGFYAIFAVATSCLNFKSNKTFGNVVNVLIVSASFYFGIWTGSRAFVVTFIVFILLFIPSLFIFSKNNKFNLLLITIAFTSLFFVFVILDNENRVIAGIFDRFEKGDPLGDRGNLMEQYFNFLFNNPKYLFTGTGLYNDVKLSGLNTVPHTNMIQLLTCFGVFGTLIIVGGYLYTYIIRINKNNINVFNYLPLVVAFVFTLSIQILTPYMIMYPFLIATLYANNGEQIQYPKFKIFLVLNYSLLPTGRVMHNENLSSFKFNENEAYIKLDY